VTDSAPGLDLVKFYEALDATRQARSLTWKQVSEKSKVHASTLSRMSSGRRPDADSLALLAAWSGLNPADFIVGVQTLVSDPLAELSTLLYSDPNLSREAATVFDELIKSTYRRLARKPDIPSGKPPR
jgi:transcriptional regulator with XRE-family HTH domain